MRHLMEKHHINYIPFPRKEKEEFDIKVAYANLEVPKGEIKF